MSHSTRAEPSPDDGAPIDPGTFARGLGISLRHLAEYANVAPETPMLRPADARLQRYLRDACSVLERAARLGGGRVAARDWFRHMPLSAFARRTAEELIAEGRHEELLRYLDGVERWDAGAAVSGRAGAVFRSAPQACD